MDGVCIEEVRRLFYESAIEKVEEVDELFLELLLLFEIALVVTSLSVLDLPKMESIHACILPREPSSYQAYHLLQWYSGLTLSVCPVR